MIELTNITKDYKINKKSPGLSGAFKGLFTHEYTIKRAVDDISFNISDGEIVGYIGLNGAGKSTTIKMMTGILVPTVGSCIVNGIVPYKNRMKNSKNIGVVFGQRTQLWWDLPLSETYPVLKEIYEVPDEEYKEQMKFLTEMLDLDEFMNSTVRTLSLGQRMRADIAASLIHKPKVLFLDEPTIGLDVIVKEKIRDGLKQIHSRFGTTIILTTHDMEDIQELCNRIIIIDRGKKIYDGTLQDIKSQYGYQKTIEVDTHLLSPTFLAHFKKLANSFTCGTSGSLTSLSYDAREISTAEIVGMLLKNGELRDITVKEMGLADIIKKIYSTTPSINDVVNL